MNEANKEKNYLQSEIKVYVRSIEGKDEKINLLKSAIEKLRIKILALDSEQEKNKKK